MLPDTHLTHNTSHTTPHTQHLSPFDPGKAKLAVRNMLMMALRQLGSAPPLTPPLPPPPPPPPLPPLLPPQP
jgi:hypothetical protein